MPAPADDDLGRLRLKLAAGSCDGAAAPHEELRENFVAPVATTGGWSGRRTRKERDRCASSSAMAFEGRALMMTGEMAW